MGARSAPGSSTLVVAIMMSSSSTKWYAWTQGVFEDPHGGRRFQADDPLSAERCLIAACGGVHAMIIPQGAGQYVCAASGRWSFSTNRTQRMLFPLPGSPGFCPVATLPPWRRLPNRSRFWTLPGHPFQPRSELCACRGSPALATNQGSSADGETHGSCTWLQGNSW